MFDIGWGELLVIGVVALVVIGPKELPTVLRTVGQWMTKIRRMASEFQGQFQEAMREAEFAELKQQVDSMRDLTRDTSLNPLETVRKEMQSALDAPAAPIPAAQPPEPAGTIAAAADPPPLPEELRGPEPIPAAPEPSAGVSEPAPAPSPPPASVASSPASSSAPAAPVTAAPVDVAPRPATPAASVPEGRPA